LPAEELLSSYPAADIVRAEAAAALVRCCAEETVSVWQKPSGLASPLGPAVPQPETPSTVS
jgi:hypothetical protein